MIPPSAKHLPQKIERTLRAIAWRDDHADDRAAQVRQIGRAARDDEDVGRAAAETAEVRLPLWRSQTGMPHRHAVAPPAEEVAQRYSGAGDVVEHERTVPTMLIHDLGRDLEPHRCASHERGSDVQESPSSLWPPGSEARLWNRLQGGGARGEEVVPRTVGRGQIDLHVDEIERGSPSAEAGQVHGTGTHDGSKQADDLSCRNPPAFENRRRKAEGRRRAMSQERGALERGGALTVVDNQERLRVRERGRGELVSARADHDRDAPKGRGSFAT